MSSRGVAVALELILYRLAVASACDLEGSEFFITDMDAMMDILEDNIKLNRLEDRVKMELLDWYTPRKRRCVKMLIEKDQSTARCDRGEAHRLRDRRRLRMSLFPGHLESPD